MRRKKVYRKNRRSSYKSKKNKKLKFMKCRLGKIKFNLKEISFGDIASTISAICTVVTVCVSIQALQYTQEKDLYDTLDNMDIQLIGIDRNYDTKYTQLESNQVEKNVIPIKYDLIISNNANKKTSIISDSLWHIIDGEGVLYSNLIKDIYFNNDKNTNLPISVDAGDHIIMNIELNYFINTEVNNAIKGKYKYNSTIVFRELENYLIKNNLDIYGNKYEEMKYKDGNVYGRKTIAPMLYPKYDVELKTSTGQVFNGKIDVQNSLGY